MPQSHPQIDLLAAASIIGLVILTAALLSATRRYLLPGKPVAAASAATAVLGLAYLLTSVAGVPTGPVPLALAPAAGMVVTAKRPLAAEAWLRGAATLAVVLTLFSVLSGESLMTVFAGAAASGVLCFLLGHRSAAGSSF